MKELLKAIGINTPGYYKGNNKYIIDINSSDEYSKIFSLLDRTDLVDEIDNESISNSSNSKVVYGNDDYLIELNANFDANSYNLVITEF